MKTRCSRPVTTGEVQHDRKQHNLPPPHDPFFGREALQRALHAHLDQPWCRLVTLVGPGGIGKTRLAVRVARNRVDSYSDGVWLVELSHLDQDDPDLVEALAVEIASAVNLRLQGRKKPLTQLLTHLEDKRLLLLLDNVDALGKAGLSLITRLLARCERLQLLVTSREPLDMRAEWVVKLSGLNYQAVGGHAPHSDAMKLFLARRKQRQGRDMDTDELYQAWHLVHKLEGWPLAIEFAASLAENIPVSEILRQVEYDVGPLTVPLTDVPPRHRSLEAVFDTSWQALSPDLQRRLARLSTFQGSFTGVAALYVAGATVSDLQALCRKSLLSRDERTGRYQLHLTVRRRAAARLPVHDSAPRLHTRHYLDELALYRDALRSEGLREMVSLIERDIDNIRVAWRRALAAVEVERLMAALPTLSAVYQLRGLTYEGEAVMGTTWETVMSWGTTGRRLAIRAGLEWAHFLNRLGRYQQSIEIMAKTVELAREENEAWAEGMACVWWGEALWRQGEHQKAKAKFSQTFNVGCTLNDARLMAWAHQHLGIIENIEGRYRFAQDHLQHARSIWQSLHDIRKLSATLTHLGLVFYHQDDLPAAQKVLGQALDLCILLDDRHLLSLLFNNLGLLATAQGDHAQARRYLLRGLELAMLTGNLTEQSDILITLGRSYQRSGQSELARESFKRGLNVARSVGNCYLMTAAIVQLAQLRQEGGAVEDPDTLYYHALEVARQHNLQCSRCTILLGTTIFPRPRPART